MEMKHESSWMAGCLVLACLSAAILPCQSVAGTTFARDALMPCVEKRGVAGVVSILYANGVKELNEVGYADLEAKRPISADQVFAQCSQTKGFCGVTVAKLVEEGRLKLDDPVSRYIPEFAKMYVREKGTNGTYVLRPATNAITVRMCMNHSAGFPFELPNFEAMGGWSRRMPLRSVALTVAAMPVDYEPGTAYRYSNLGIDVAAAVIERITGKRWEDYLKETVLDPLEMTSSSFTPTPEQLKNRMQFYTILDDKSFTLRRKDVGSFYPFTDERVYPSAGAGLWTTANDQYKFYKMLLNYGIGDNEARILKESTVRELLLKSSRPPEITGTPASLARYSLGFKIWTDEKTGLTWFGHGGAYSSGCYMCHERKLLKLKAVQVLGYNGPAWGDQLEAASEAFFRSVGVDIRRKNEKPKPVQEKTSANAERGEVVL